MHLLECRSILATATIRHVTMDSRSHGHRVLLLNDSMGVVLAFMKMKGRCTNFSLLRLLRRTWAHCLSPGSGEKVWKEDEGESGSEDCSGAGRCEGAHKEGLRKEAEHVLAFHELLDVVLSDYADFLYLSGEDSNYGQKLQAALEFWRLEAAGKGR